MTTDVVPLIPLTANERRSATRRANAYSRRAAELALARALRSLASSPPGLLSSSKWTRKAVTLMIDAALMLAKD